MGWTPSLLTLRFVFARGIPNQPMLHACGLLSQHELQGQWIRHKFICRGKFREGRRRKGES